MRARSILTVLFVVLALGGCAEVAPYERETLASPRMSLDGDEGEQAMVVSRRRTREEGVVGASGSGASSSSGGGGCGCN